MEALHRDIACLWNVCFRDPSQWGNYRNTESNPRLPEVSHKRTREPLWIHGWHYPPWPEEELARRGLHIDQPRSSHHLIFTSSLNCNCSPLVPHNDTAGLLAFLKGCARQKDLCTATRIHDELRKSGLLRSNVYVASCLLNVYAKCGALAKAQEVFREVPLRNVVLWNSLIAGYTQHGHGREALSCFEQMQQQNFSPNAVTFTCILKACGSIGATEKGKEIHAEVVRQGLLERNTILGTALVDMYAKCGKLAKAQEVFDKLPVQDVVSWNALISGYAQHGDGHEALSYFEQMQRQGYSPDAVTFACSLKACGSIGALEKGEEIHTEVARRGLLETSAILGNALVDMYAKCGALAKAQYVFEELPVQDVVSWNVLIAGYVQHGHGWEALNCFERMQQEGLSADAVTFTCILKACGNTGDVEKGEEIRAKVFRQRLLERNTLLSTALVDMYAKCGVLEKAQELFDKLPVQHLDSWNALIAGYAHLGKVETALDLFDRMISEDIRPDPVTFIVLLNACSHSGLVAQGHLYFVTMSTSYGITPSLDHYTCMVNLYGRAGHFDKAIGVIKEMPSYDSSDYITVWSALLRACQKWGNVKLGSLAFEHVVKLDERDGAAYVLMSNIYAAASMQEEADKIEAMRVKNKTWKMTGCLVD